MAFTVEARDCDPAAVLDSPQWSSAKPKDVRDGEEGKRSFLLFLFLVLLAILGGLGGQRAHCISNGFIVGIHTGKVL